MKPLSRRTLMRGAGGVAIALPFLQAMRPRVAWAQAAPPKRLVMWFTSNGQMPAYWYPTGTETNFTLNTAHKALEPYKSKLIIFDGVNAADVVPEGLRVSVRDRYVLPKLVAALVSREMPVYAAVPRPRTLEDVYFAIEARIADGETTARKPQAPRLPPPGGPSFAQSHGLSQPRRCRPACSESRRLRSRRERLLRN